MLRSIELKGKGKLKVPEEIQKPNGLNLLRKTVYIPLKVCKEPLAKVLALSQANTALHKAICLWTHPAELWFLSSVLPLLPIQSRHRVCMAHTLLKGKICRGSCKTWKTCPWTENQPLAFGVSQDGKVSLYKEQKNQAKFLINPIKLY